MSWLEREGAELGPVRLGKSACGDGAGAFVTQDLEEGELLFSVPSISCISLYDACGDGDVGEELAKLTAQGQVTLPLTARPAHDHVVPNCRVR